MARWLLLAYRLPAEPSAPRVATWRALQALGGAYLLDGCYLAEATEYNALALAHLAHDIRNFHGEASVLDVARVDDEAHLARRLRAARGQGRKGRARSPGRGKRKDRIRRR